MKHIKLFGEFLNESSITDINEKVSKIACLACDEVNTRKAWEKNKGFCPSCKVSSQGVVESASNYSDKSVAEMLTDTYHKALDEAKAYEGDDNKDHTLENYVKEIASITAEKMYEMYESLCNEMRTDMTSEMYESLCNEMKKSYVSRMNEMLEEYKHIKLDETLLGESAINSDYKYIYKKIIKKFPDVVGNWDLIKSFVDDEIDNIEITDTADIFNKFEEYRKNKFKGVIGKMLKRKM